MYAGRFNLTGSGPIGSGLSHRELALPHGVGSCFCSEYRMSAEVNIDPSVSIFVQDIPVKALVLADEWAV